MSTTLTLQPGQNQYIGGVNQDKFLNVGLTNSKALLDDQDLFRVVSALQQAQIERVASRRYRIHGTINPISFLTNKPTNWTTVRDLISHTVVTDLRSDFELCLGYIAKYVPVPALGANYYERRLKVVSTKQNVDLLPCGFAKNVFSEPSYNFMLNGEINLDGITTDGLGAPWPITDIYTYLRPLTPFTTVPLANPVDVNTFLAGTIYGFKENDPLGTQATLATSLVRFIRPTTLSNVLDADWSTFIYPEVLSLFRLGDVRLTATNIEINQAYIRAWVNLLAFSDPVSGEQTDADGLVPFGISYFDPETLEIRDVTNLTYGLTRTLTIPNTTQNSTYLQKLGYTATALVDVITMTLSFLYEPMQSVSIRQFSEFIEQGNTATTVGIPDNALLVTTGGTDVHWRDILDPGYIEPTSGRGNNTPFLNGCHYLYAPLTYVIGPNLTDPNTFQAFRSARIGLTTPTFRV